MNKGCFLFLYVSVTKVKLLKRIFNLKMSYSVLGVDECCIFSAFANCLVIVNYPSAGSDLAAPLAAGPIHLLAALPAVAQRQRRPEHQSSSGKKGQDNYDIELLLNGHHHLGMILFWTASKASCVWFVNL